MNIHLTIAEKMNFLLHLCFGQAPKSLAARRSVTVFLLSGLLDLIFESSSPWVGKNYSTRIRSFPTIGFSQNPTPLQSHTVLSFEAFFYCVTIYIQGMSLTCLKDMLACLHNIDDRQFFT